MSTKRALEILRYLWADQNPLTDKLIAEIEAVSTSPNYLQTVSMQAGVWDQVSRVLAFDNTAIATIASRAMAELELNPLYNRFTGNA